MKTNKTIKVNEVKTNNNSFRSVIIAKLTYAVSARRGFTKASKTQKRTARLSVTF